MSGYSFTDEETKGALKEIYNQYSYVADPHGAVGYLGCKASLKDNPDTHCVFLETAHPTKFLDVVEDTIKTSIALPDQIKTVIDKEKQAISISDYNGLKSFLLS